jgi:hypothetical protein
MNCEGEARVITLPDGTAIVAHSVGAMVTIKIAGRVIHAERTALEPYEAAHLLQVPLREVRNALRRKSPDGLTPIWQGRRRAVSPHQLADRVGDDPLAFEVLVARSWRGA